MVEFKIGEIVDVTYWNKKKLSRITEKSYGIDRFWIRHLDDNLNSDIEIEHIKKDRIANLLYG